MKLTDYEKSVIAAILDSEYGDDPTDPVWYPYIAEECGVPADAMSGVVASLSKKDLAHTDGLADTYRDGQGDMPSIWLTDAGVAAARANGVTGFKLD